jgi:hypothetical protein
MNKTIPPIGSFGQMTVSCGLSCVSSGVRATLDHRTHTGTYKNVPCVSCGLWSVAQAADQDQHVMSNQQITTHNRGAQVLLTGTQVSPLREQSQFYTGFLSRTTRLAVCGVSEYYPHG